MRLCVWSGPASLSTVLMYSFGNRGDTTAVDEPFYAHYLSTSTPDIVARHPGVDEVLGFQHKEAKDVVDKVILADYKSKVVYFKMMSHHITPKVDVDFLDNTVNVILIRDPTKIVASFVKRMNKEGTAPTMKDVGVQDLYSLQQSLRNKYNQDPIVVDADDLQADPVSILTQLCDRLGLPFDDKMLKWESGPKPYDGIWAKHWYSDVHTSVGWNVGSEANKIQQPATPLSAESKKLADECLGYYKKLRGSLNRIRPAPPLPDARNEDIWVWVGSGLVKRKDAKVSVLDSIVQGGDGVWEGLRVYNGKIFCLDAHLDRLFDSTKAMGFSEVPSREEIKYAIFATFRANKMYNNAHARLTLTRGKKVTSSMDPRKNQYGPTLIVLAEFKPPIYSTAGITLVTSAIRRNTPSCLDSKIHHNNLCNNILAKIQANNAGADDAVMLDINGFVSETNATNIFFIKRGVLLTPHADSCLHGITRAKVLELARKSLSIPVEERNISIAELYSCDECFVTGTMGEITAVLSVDGRHIGDSIGEITQKILTKYLEEANSYPEGEQIPGLAPN